jgi:hypothetical protein
MTTEHLGLTSWANLLAVFQIAQRITVRTWKSLLRNWLPQQLADFFE